MTKPPLQPWFAPKRFGYGSGLPIAWQGWVVLGIHLSLVTLAAIDIKAAPVSATIVILLSTAALLLICKGRTEGGWRWRNGR